MPGEHALRRTGHHAVPGRLAVGQAADTGSGFACTERRNHLRNRVDLHVHSGTRPPTTLLPDGRYHAWRNRSHEQHARLRPVTANTSATTTTPTARHVKD